VSPKDGKDIVEKRRKSCPCR